MGNLLPNIDDLKKRKKPNVLLQILFFQMKKNFLPPKTFLFEEGVTTLVLSAGYRFNGPLQTCCQLR